MDVDDNDSGNKAVVEDGGGEDEGSWDAWLDMMDAAAPGDDTDACIEKEATGVDKTRGELVGDKGDKDDDESWIQGMMEMGSSSSIFAEEGEGVWKEASRMFVRKENAKGAVKSAPVPPPLPPVAAPKSFKVRLPTGRTKTGGDRMMPPELALKALEEAQNSQDARYNSVTNIEELHNILEKVSKEMQAIDVQCETVFSDC